MADSNDIQERIPHRPPFLWVDRIVSLKEGRIEAEKKIHADLDIFKGHYPDQPVMPGVLTCEAVFQTGALLLSEMESQLSDMTKIPVLTRIKDARFKKQVRPGDLLQLIVEIDEIIGPAWFMKGKALVGGKVAVRVNFAVTLVDKNS